MEVQEKNSNTRQRVNVDTRPLTDLDAHSLFDHSDFPSSRQPRTLQEFRDFEGRGRRKQHLQEIWQWLSSTRERRPTDDCLPKEGPPFFTASKAVELRSTYDRELVACCGVYSSCNLKSVGWKEFKEYAEAKEVELWAIFHELDLDGNGHLDAHELSTALHKAGIPLSSKMLDEFITALSSSQPEFVSFADFRDFLLLLPRRASPAEIYQYYQLRKFLGDDDRGTARVTMEGDAFLSAEDKPPSEAIKTKHRNATTVQLHPPAGTAKAEAHDIEDEEDKNNHMEPYTALRYLLAGGIAGAVSRTCTAPFDRLRVFLITRPPNLGGAPTSSTSSFGGIRIIVKACARIYSEGGILAFWTGNGLSVAKIFPESAIKFYAYESSKRAFARYWDHVDEVRDISGLSRFLSGGLGGIASQLTIYPIETLKTQMMSNSGQHKRTLIEAARHVWNLGGVRAYYRGLTIGLFGVFPYSAIDMSTFEALKLAYVRSTGKEEPGVMTLLAFGSLSGSVGATSVYPLNLIRTRLQASGSSGHPQRYTGVVDVAIKTWESGGWRAFYRGLVPTLAKVVPSVSITYVVYEHAKRKLGVI